MEKHVVQHLAALLGGFDGDLQCFDDPALSYVVLEDSRTQRDQVALFQFVPVTRPVGLAGAVEFRGRLDAARGAVARPGAGAGSADR